jgi:hypothetical protein
MHLGSTRLVAYYSTFTGNVKGFLPADICAPLSGVDVSVFVPISFAFAMA